jgi:hypothetical protein
MVMLSRKKCFHQINYFILYSYFVFAHSKQHLEQPSNSFLIVTAGCTRKQPLNTNQER